MQQTQGDQEILSRAEELVKAHMAKCVCLSLDCLTNIADVYTRYDPSHDWAHGVSGVSVPGSDNVLIPQ